MNRNLDFSFEILFPSLLNNLLSNVSGRRDEIRDMIIYHFGNETVEYIKGRRRFSVYSMN